MWHSQNALQGNGGLSIVRCRAPSARIMLLIVVFLLAVVLFALVVNQILQAI
ncbi:hypothetical protein MUP00_09240 [Candidatus Bathyarchaeota archaeon]|nr:hypothetical protein [Candidatus Bathyarchaeota archaeon]